MVEIKITGSTPLEALSSLVAFGMRGMQIPEVLAAANRILEAEKYEAEKKLPTVREEETPSETTNTATPPLQKVPEANTTQTAPAPTEASGPVDGANGPTSAPGDAPKPTPTVEQVRAKGIEASRKYGKEAVVAILQKYKVTGMSAIAEKDRAAFLADLERLGEEDA